MGAARDRQCAEELAELAGARVLDRRGEQLERAVELGRRRPRERLVREDLAGAQIDDRLVDDADLALRQHPVDRVAGGR